MVLQMSHEITPGRKLFNGRATGKVNGRLLFLEQAIIAKNCEEALSILMKFFKGEYPNVDPDSIKFVTDFEEVLMEAEMPPNDGR
jgi:hypothetical protein